MLKSEQELKDLLIAIANRPHWNSEAEDFCVEDYAGGNVDDAFYSGERVGAVLLARELLLQLFDVTVVDEE